MRQTNTRLTRPIGIALVLLALAAGAGFIGANTVRSSIISQGYYEELIDDSDAVDRALNEVTGEDDLVGEVTDILGGFEDFLGDFDALSNVIPPELLDEAVSIAIEKFIAFLKSERRLDLSIEVTPFIELIDDGAVENVGADIITLPKRQSRTYNAFLQDLRATIERLRDDGDIPDFIPTFNIPEARRTEVSDLILKEANFRPGFSENFIALAVRAAVAANDPASALKAALVPMLAEQSESSVNGLLGGGLIHKDTAADGEPVYRFGPPDDVERDLELSLKILQTLVSTSEWLWSVGAAAFVIAVVLIVLLALPDRVRALRWAGLALFVTGATVIVAWLITWPILRTEVVNLALKDEPPSPAFRSIVEDVLHAGIDNLAPTILVPAGVLFLIGALAIAASTFMRGNAGDTALATVAVGPAQPNLAPPVQPERRQPPVQRERPQPPAQQQPQPGPEPEPRPAPVRKPPRLR